jgi:hypothetical protein
MASSAPRRETVVPVTGTRILNRVRWSKAIYASRDSYRKRAGEPVALRVICSWKLLPSEAGSRPMKEHAVTLLASAAMASSLGFSLD